MLLTPSLIRFGYVTYVLELEESLWLRRRPGTRGRSRFLVLTQ